MFAGRCCSQIKEMKTNGNHGSSNNVPELSIKLCNCLVLSLNFGENSCVLILTLKLISQQL